MSVIKNNRFHYSVPYTCKGIRVDKFLGTLNEVHSRSRAIQLIQSKLVWVDEHVPKPSQVLKGGESIVIEIPEPPPIELQALDLELDIIFEDSYLIVLNKPPGLVVHPAAGHEQDTLVNALIAHSHDFAMKFGENRPGIVHRLDKDTSGVMVVAKTDLVQEALAQQFKERTIDRYYFAVTNGIVKQKTGVIQSYLARHPSDRKKFSSIRDHQKKIIRDKNLNPGLGKWSHTEYQVLSYYGSEFSYLKLKLQTGRTHQIRVHLSELNHSILGDEIYSTMKKSSTLSEIPRLALHAAELGFTHPITKERMCFKKDWPADFNLIIQKLFGETFI